MPYAKPKPHTDKHQEHNHTLHRWLIGAGIVTAMVITAPHVLPLIGIGELEVTGIFGLCGDSGSASGVAGGVASWMSNHIPWIGAELAKGGLINAAVSGFIGLGGAMLGNYLQKNEDGTQSIKWSSVIKTAALATSLLIAVPALFPAISMGVSFLGGMLLDAEAATAVKVFMTSTFGTVSGAFSLSEGLGATAMLLPHLLTCGVSFGAAAAATSANIGKGSIPDKTHEKPTIFQDIPKAPPSQNIPVDSFIQRLHKERMNPPANALLSA